MMTLTTKTGSCDVGDRQSQLRSAVSVVYGIPVYHGLAFDLVHARYLKVSHG